MSGLSDILYLHAADWKLESEARYLIKDSVNQGHSRVQLLGVLLNSQCDFVSLSGLCPDRLTILTSQEYVEGL